MNFPPAEHLKGKGTIYVKTLSALQDIARYVRMRSNIPRHRHNRDKRKDNDKRIDSASILKQNTGFIRIQAISIIRLAFL